MARYMVKAAFPLQLKDRLLIRNKYGLRYGPPARLRDYPDIKGDPTDAFISAQTHKIQGENTTSIHGQILHQLSPTAICGFILGYKCRSLSLCGFTLAQASGLIKGILPQPFVATIDPFKLDNSCCLVI
ncbi:hypothetical protein YC2023_089251 [Brassica napus]